MCSVSLATKKSKFFLHLELALNHWLNSAKQRISMDISS